MEGSTGFPATGSNRLFLEALARCRYSVGEIQGQGQELDLKTFSLPRLKLHGADSSVQTLVPSSECPQGKVQPSSRCSAMRIPPQWEDPQVGENHRRQVCSFQCSHHAGGSVLRQCAHTWEGIRGGCPGLAAVTKTSEARHASTLDGLGLARRLCPQEKLSPYTSE